MNNVCVCVGGGGGVCVCDEPESKFLYTDNKVVLYCVPVNNWEEKKLQKCRSSTHCSWGTCRSDSRFPQLAV